PQVPCRSELPGPLADQRDTSAAGAEAGRLEFRAPYHDVEMDRRAVHSLDGSFRTRSSETAAEREVRGRVLVEQRVVVDAARLADPRGGVDECDLPETAPHPIGVDETGDEVAIVVRVGFEPDEPAVRELTPESMNEPAAERERKRAAERPA